MRRTRLPWILPLAGFAGLALSSTPLAAAETPPATLPDPNGAPIEPVVVGVWTSHDPAGPAPAPNPTGVPEAKNTWEVKPSASPVTPEKSAAELKSTTVTAHLREAHAAGKNLLWCNTFQLAWDAAGKACGQDIKLNPESEMAQVLNEHLASKDDIDAKACLAMAGYGRDGIVAKIEKALDAQFPGHDDFFKRSVGDAVPANSLVAFAYLQKNLTFAQPFFTQTDRSLDFAGQQVKTFGVWDDPHLKNRQARLDQVKIVDYKSSRDYIVELQSQATDDRLILARIAPGKALKDTIDAAVKRVQAAPAKLPTLDARETFLAPVIDLNILREYNEIEKHTFFNTDEEKFTILKAMQSTRFKLNERGAEVLSQATLVALADDEPEPKRAFIFNEPFLVMLLRKDAKMPYFALWIENAELLVADDGPIDHAHGGAATVNPPDQGEIQERARMDGGPTPAEHHAVDPLPPAKRRPQTPPPQPRPLEDRAN